jgi:putative DNA primase/helicase
MSVLEYERCRKAEAKKLGIRQAVLDAEVEKVRPNTRALEARESLAPTAPEPWQESLEPAALLDELRDFIKRFIIVSEHALIAITLWITFTYFFEIAETSPRLAILSPMKRCGKTRLLEILLMLCLRPVSASNLSASAVFRTIDLEHPTLLIDEADTANANKNDELRGILNSGHTPANAYVIRSVPLGEKEWTPKRVSTWCPIAMAAIGRLPETWLDRSIVIRMQRKSPASKVERLTRRNKEAREQAAALASKLTRLAADNLEIVRAANPEIPDLGSDRTIDNWEHLFAIAELGGDEWTGQARIAALALSGAAAETDDSLNIKLLMDIKAIFDADDAKPDRISSTELCKRLANLELSPWAIVSRGKPLTPARLARMLKIFEIRPSENASGSGYAKADFTEAFACYVPTPPDQSAKVPQTLGAVGESAISEVRPDGTSENAETPTERATCGTMAVSNGGIPMDDTFSNADSDAERFDCDDEENPDRERFE